MQRSQTPGCAGSVPTRAGPGPAALALAAGGVLDAHLERAGRLPRSRTCADDEEVGEVARGRHSSRASCARSAASVVCGRAQHDRGLEAARRSAWRRAPPRAPSSPRRAPRAALAQRSSARRVGGLSGSGTARGAPKAPSRPGSASQASSLVKGSTGASSRRRSRAIRCSTVWAERRRGAAGRRSRAGPSARRGRTRTGRRPRTARAGGTRRGTRSSS